MARVAMTFEERLRNGTPLRVGELAVFTGFSTNQIRKWMDAGTVAFIRVPDSAERRIPCVAARRLGEILQVLETEDANSANKTHS